MEIKPELLPYNLTVINFLQKEFNNGRKIILATASLKSVAVNIAAIYPVFSEVYGTENKINLKGKKKLEKLIKQFGICGFDYIGNSRADLVIFKSSRFSYLVNPSERLKIKTGKVSILKAVWYSD